MALPALVLVHGAGHASDCWDLTVDEIHRLAPKLTVLAVDLPGRRSRPGDLRTLTIADSVDSVVADIEDAGLDEIVIVGHSMAGVTVPGVVARLGASRVREMILAAANVPRDGAAIVDVVTGLMGVMARRNAKRGEPAEMPQLAAGFMLLNGVPRARRRFMRHRLYPESTRIPAESVSRESVPDEVPRTWILTLRDRINPAKAQRNYIDDLGVQTLIEIDTCHDLMISEPELLAEILVDRCRLYT